MDFLKNTVQKINETIDTINEAAKIYTDIQSEKKKIKHAEQKIKHLQQELGKMLYLDRAKSPLTLDVHYQIKLNLISAELEKISDAQSRLRG